MMIAWKYDRVEAAQGFSYILFQGVRFDLILATGLILIPLLLTPFISKHYALYKVWDHLIRFYLVFCFASILFVELSTPSFINQYDLRPNYLFVEYLKYPKEVLSTLWGAYKLELIASILITIIAGYSLNRVLYKHHAPKLNIGWGRAALVTPIILIVCFLLIRSTLDHRAVNPSTVAFSSDPLMNMMPLSSGYSVLYAIHESRFEKSDNHAYGRMASDEATSLVKQEMLIDEGKFVSGNASTLHQQRAYIQRKKPLNLVIILEESLGSDYVGALGGKQITPKLDALSKQGIWFNNLYATGTRSVRGIEAVITGFTPTSSRSVVKLPKAQTNFFTIAKLLASQNYKTSFIYGGESHFDNMKRFFSNNGFEKIVDENDYENPVFYGSWGASDEDLFNKAHDEFETYNPDQPFFSLVFTSSNHPPFDYPEGRIKVEGKEKATVDNAVKYADFALGQYIEKARQSKYWNNTLFLIVADHSDKVYGSELVPIQRFQIPALILGADIPPVQFKAVSSQIDLLPTMLSLMGVNSTHPAIGRDLSKIILTGNDEYEGRAIMQFGGAQAYMQGNSVAIMSKNKPVKEFKYVNKTLVSSQGNNTELKKKALAHAVWTVNTYQNNEYGFRYLDVAQKIDSGESSEN